MPIVLPTPTVDERGNANHAPIVYYMASELGGVVKIGTTTHYEKRMTRLMRAQPALRPILLAYEYGDQRLEFERHRQFRQSLQQGEWFWLTLDLAAHIRALGGAV